MGDISKDKHWNTSKLENHAYELRNLYEPVETECYPYIGLEHIEQNTLKLNSVGKSTDTVSTKKYFSKGDILFGSLRPYFRKVIRPKFDGVCSTDITVIRGKDCTDTCFLHYFIANHNFIDHASNISSGTRMPRASWKVLSKTEWLFPPLPTQRKIAAILSAYDDLIENNLRRIKILEEMAQTLYREWFVNFRFPGHEKVRFVDSPLGRIPEGWSIKQLHEACNITMGQSPKSEFYNSNGAGLPFHQGVSNFGKRYPVTKYYCTLKNRIANKDDILFSVRAPVGRINIADTKMVIGRGLSAIRHKSGWQRFLYYFLRDTFKEEDIIGGGTIFKSATKKDMESIKILNPEKEIIERFEFIVAPMEKLIESLEKKNVTLRQTRDLLLPKLISGEVAVSELDIKVPGEAAS